LTRVPPTRSLTSPFPMQFRSRGVTERVDKLIGAISEESEPTRPIIESLRTSTIPLVRIQSSPSNLSMKPLPGKKNRPPPCPGRRAPLGTRPQRTSRRRQTRWRDRLNARSSSILDEDEDDDDDDADDDKEEDGDDDSEKSDEGAVIRQAKGLRLT
jgi:hypothetical protein